jgi:catechol 2,3-dioxygenase-like lactoylglutathione lyase family enzyme
MIRRRLSHNSEGLELNWEEIMIATLRAWSLAIGLIVVAIGLSASLQVTDHKAPDRDHLPRLVNTCLITNDLKRLVEFYEPVLVLKAKRSGEDYAEFATSVGVLAIFSAKAQEKYIPGSSEAAKNRVILEFSVADVDQEYQRLQSLVKTWVKPPTTQPWGTRSIYFRDPDGNLVDSYARIQAQ